MPKAKRSKRTAGDVIAWYVRRLPIEALGAEPPSPEAQTERLRILSRFNAEFATRALARCLPVDLLDFILGRPGLKAAWTRRRWLSIIMRPFNRAAKLGVIARNPFAGAELPPGEDGRDLTDEEFRALLRRSPAPFRRVLLFLRLSGARPGEMRAAKVEHVKLDAACLVLSKHKTSRKTRRPRCIVLNSVLVKLVTWLIPRAGQGGHLFLNASGRPWTTGALTKNVRRLRENLGLPDDVKLYGCRHAFATGAIVNGANPAVVAEFLGHTGLQRIPRYTHLAGKKQYLMEAIEQAARVPISGKRQVG
jgi:integrase